MLSWFVRRRHRGVDARLGSVIVGCISVIFVIFVIECCWVDGRDLLDQIRGVALYRWWLRHWRSFLWVG